MDCEGCTYVYVYFGFESSSGREAEMTELVEACAEAMRRLVPVEKGEAFVSACVDGCGVDEARVASEAVAAVRRVVVECRHKGKDVVMRGGIAQVSAAGQEDRVGEDAKLLAKSTPVMQITIDMQTRKNLGERFMVVERLPYEMYGKKVSLFLLGRQQAV